MTTILIYGSPDYTSQMLDEAERLVQAIWWLRMSHDLRLLMGDGYGTDARVAAVAQRERVPYIAVGVCRRARNSTRHYLRFIPPLDAQTRIEQYAARDRYMVAAADRVFCLGQSLEAQAVYEYAKLLGKDVQVRAAAWTR
jgi:hypothetical protein